MFTVRRAWTVLCVSAICAGASSAAAQAAAKLTLSPATITPGTPVKASGSGYAANEVVDVTIDGGSVAAQTAVANTKGGFSTNLPLPSSIRPGPHQVTGVGRSSAAGAGATLTITTPWTQDGFNGAHTADNPFENQITQDTVGRLSAAWIGAPDGSSGASSPVVAGGRVFFLTSKGLYAYKAACGTNAAPCTPLWHADLASNGALQAPVVLGSTVFARPSSSDSKLYAFKTNCGTGGATCSPTWTAPAAGDLVMAADASHLYLTTGSTLEAFKATCGASTCTPVWSATLDTFSTSGPSVVNGVVYAGSEGGTLYAFSDKACTAGTCTPLWTAKSATTALDTDLVVANGRIFSSGEAFGTTCSASPCAPQWSNGLVPDLFTGEAAYGDHLYVGSTALVAQSQTCPTSGSCPVQTIWPYTATPPTAAANVLYTSHPPIGAVHAPAAIVAYAPDCGSSCTPLWQASPTGDSSELFDSSPVVSDGTLYATTNEGRLYAYTLNGQAAGTTP